MRRGVVLYAEDTPLPPPPLRLPIDQTEMTYNDMRAQLKGKDVMERKGGGRTDAVVLCCVRGRSRDNVTVKKETITT